MVSVRLITSGCTMAVSRGALSLLKCRIGTMPLDRYATRWGEFCSRGPFIGPRDASSRPDTRTGQSQGTSGQGRKIVSNLNDCRLKSIDSGQTDSLAADAPTTDQAKIG